MPFHFRLETLLTVRKRTRDEHRRVVADCLRRVQQCVTTMESLRRREQETMVDARQSREHTTMDVSLVLQEQRWRMHLQRRVSRILDLIKTREAELDVARNALAERTRDVKALERLREKRESEYRYEEARKEQTSQDELAAQMVVQRKSDPYRQCNEGC